MFLSQIFSLKKEYTQTQTHTLTQHHTNTKVPANLVFILCVNSRTGWLEDYAVLRWINYCFAFGLMVEREQSLVLKLWLFITIKSNITSHTHTHMSYKVNNHLWYPAPAVLCIIELLQKRSMFILLVCSSCCSYFKSFVETHRRFHLSELRDCHGRCSTDSLTFPDCML